MAEGNVQSIQIVLPRKEDIRKNEVGGGLKFFGECTQDLRRDLASQFEGLLECFEGQFRRYPTVPCVGIVTVKEGAIAKTHKPTRLLSKTNCPI